jgi:hypothetical protein
MSSECPLRSVVEECGDLPYIFHCSSCWRSIVRGQANNAITPENFGLRPNNYYNFGLRPNNYIINFHLRRDPLINLINKHRKFLPTTDRACKRRRLYCARTTPRLKGVSPSRRHTHRHPGAHTDLPAPTQTPINRNRLCTHNKKVGALNRATPNGEMDS